VVTVDDDDITRRFHGGDELSEAANPSQARKLRDRSRILRQVLERGAVGATCEELEILLFLPHQTCSARIAELRRLGWLLDSGQRRLTRSGRSARVHVLADWASA
jgi:hypothetical protein